MTRASREPSPGRRRLAMWATVLWLLAFELGPDLHLATHGWIGSHSHGLAGDDHHIARHDVDHHHLDHGHVDHRHVERDPGHRHDAGHDHDAGDDHDADAAPDADREASVGKIDFDHGRHDLSHRGIAVLVPTSPMPVLMRASALGPATTPRPHAPPDDRRPGATRARGPPSLGARA